MGYANVTAGRQALNYGSGALFLLMTGELTELLGMDSRLV